MSSTSRREGRRTRAARLYRLNPQAAGRPDDAGALETLAIQDHFVAAERASEAPRLAAYLERYPERADALIEWALWRDAGSPVDELASADTNGDADGEDDEATGAHSPSLAPGTLRALDRLFGPARLQRVAEPTQDYDS